MTAYWVTLLSILVSLEAPKTPEAAARAERREGAVGVLQIRPIYLQDVNERCTKAVMAKYGRLLTSEDMRDPETAKWTAHQYLTYWSRYYTRKTGRALTAEVHARMHNGGGVSGWKKSATDEYWAKFKAECKTRSIDPVTLKHIDGGAK